MVIVSWLIRRLFFTLKTRLMILKGMTGDEIRSQIREDGNLITKARGKLLRSLSDHMRKRGKEGGNNVAVVDSEKTRNRYAVHATWYKGKVYTYYAAIANLYGMGNDFVIPVGNSITVITAHAMKRIKERVICPVSVKDPIGAGMIIIGMIFRPDMVYPMSMANDPSFLYEGTEGLLRSLADGRVFLIRCDRMFLIEEPIEDGMCVIRTAMDIKMVSERKNRKIGTYLSSMFYIMNKDKVDFSVFGMDRKDEIRKAVERKNDFFLCLFGGYQNRVGTNKVNLERNMLNRIL